MSFEELMSESAEVLPGRETLCVTHFYNGGGFQPGGLGNTAQVGLVNVSGISALNGTLNGTLDHDNVLNALSGLFVPIGL
jgi:hypothetical protein